MTRILITGGAGFIGSNLCRKLSPSSTIWVFDNLLEQVHGRKPDLSELNSHAKLIKGDIRDRQAVDDAIRQAQPELIYHFAAETGTGQSFDETTRYVDVNVMGTAHLIEAIRAHGPDLKRVVLAGSRSVYGEGACEDSAGTSVPAQMRRSSDLAAGDYAPKDRLGRSLTPVPSHAGTPVNPVSIYASTKYSQENLLRQAFWGRGVDVGILRLQNVFGAGQSLRNPYTGVISIFLSQLAAGNSLNIYEDGQIVRDFVYIDDVVDAFDKIGRVESCPDDIIDIGSGEGTTILDMAQRLMDKLGLERDRYEITGDFRPGDIRHAMADISAARSQLGWSPQVSLSDGLDRFMAWAKDGVSA